MLMKKIMVCISLGFIILLLTGCSFFPTYFSKKEVKQYVKELYGESYELIDENSYEKETGKKEYEYIFKNGEGISFSIYTYTSHLYFTGNESIFYEKVIRDNYTDSVINFYINDIERVCSEASFDINIDDYNNITFYLDSYTQISEAADIIEKIDKIVSFYYNEDFDSKYKFCYSCPYEEIIAVYLKPNNIEDSDWKENYDYRISIELSNNDESRLKNEDIITTIEQELVNDIKRGKTYYTIPEEILSKYSSH